MARGCGTSRLAFEHLQAPHRLGHRVVAFAEGEAHQVIPPVEVRCAGVAEGRHGDRCDARAFGQLGAERGAVGVSERPGVGAEEVGAVAVVDKRGHLVGFFTDGDLRRLIDVRDRPADAHIADVMTRNPKSARRDDYVVDAAKIMREYRIDELPVVDEAGACVGMIDIQDLISAGFSVFDAR